MNQQSSDFFSDPNEWPQVIIQRLSSQRNEHQQPAIAHRPQNVIAQFSSEQQSTKYPYSRGFHYFFDLDTFQRDHQSKSYARDLENSFKSTYPEDEKMYGGSKLKDIINRQYFTLPIREAERGRPANEANPNKYALFQTEDKKLGFDRLIVTCRQILNNLQQLIHTEKIYNFMCLYKDKKLQQIFNPNTTLSQKRQILIDRLQGLMEAKRLSEREWYAQDNMNINPSRNQRHYGLIKTKIAIFQRSRVVSSLYSNHFYLKELIKDSTNDQLINFIQRIFTFYRQDRKSMKRETVEHLIFNHKNKIVQVYHQLSGTIFPSHILSFSHPEVFKITNEILRKRMTLKSNYEFYLLNTLCKRLFKTQLQALQDCKVEEQYIYKCDASKEISKIRNFKKIENKQIQNYQQQAQNLDEELNYQGLLTEQNQIFILKRREVIEISGIQYLILMLWHWMNLVVKELYPYLKQNPEFIQMIASPHFHLINISVSQAFSNPLIGTLNYCIEEISQHLIEEKDLNFEKFKLEFEFRQEKNLAIVWRVQNHEQHEGGQKEKQMEQMEQIDYDILHFGKRIKSLENQWV